VTREQQELIMFTVILKYVTLDEKIWFLVLQLYSTVRYSIYIYI